MLIDVNLLLLAIDEQARSHARARDWLSGVLNGSARVGFPWQSLGGFLRIVTHPRALDRPLRVDDALGFVRDWLAAGVAWIPEPGPGYLELLAGLMSDHDTRGNLVPDARLAALAIEHGLVVCSADSDFARFPEVRWLNPLTG